MFQIIPNDIDIDFGKFRKPFLILSLLVCIASLGGVFGIGPNYGIDFKEEPLTYGKSCLHVYHVLRSSEHVR